MVTSLKLCDTRHIVFRGDNTQTGHILGRAQVRGQGTKPERTMAPTYTATVRLILHMSMLVGVGSNVQVY